MATLSSVTTQHVLQALVEYDTRGGEVFLEVYGFRPSPEYTLVHEGRSYDAQAVLGVAHRFATGRLATPDEVANGMPGAIAILRRRGFEVTAPAGVSRAATPARATRPARTPVARTAPTRPTAVREAPEAICPTCSMTLPATGVCDYCS